MMRWVMIGVGVAVVVCVAVGCSDNGTGSGGDKPYVALFVGEVTCPYSANVTEHIDSVRAEVEFVPEGDSVGQIVRYESPGPVSVSLNAGEYRVRVRSGRADGVWEMPGLLVISATSAPQVTVERGWWEAPRMGIDSTGALRVATVAYTDIPSVARIHFYYSQAADSLGTAEEMEAMTLLNEMTGRHMTIEVGSREVYPFDWGSVGVDYRIPVNPSVFLFDVLDDCLEVMDADTSLFPSQMYVYPWGMGICLD